MNHTIKFHADQRIYGTLTKNKKLQIEELTKNLLNDIRFRYPPCVDVISLVKKDNIEVLAREMPLNTTGRLMTDANGKWQIIVNTVFPNPENEADIALKKSRFVTALEYGHYKLHKMPQRSRRDSGNPFMPEELEADYFARSILMPMEYFEPFYYLLNPYGDNTDSTTELLSGIFKVTENKVSRRIKDITELSGANPNEECPFPGHSSE